ncbi:NIL domain-containing protein [Agathobacter ruminis]|uniref:NIL domain-containing protein n=1 Tax=Agathobacter ruminis TaxID=1712665 RepID=A0A2G3E1B4_9FIRM|nr:hypothetical protein CSX02_09820 [Agathobacter ruminis]
MVQTTGENINILGANTRSVGGIAYGQMIVELPGRKRGLDYFAQIGITAVSVS